MCSRCCEVESIHSPDVADDGARRVSQLSEYSRADIESGPPPLVGDSDWQLLLQQLWSGPESITVHTTLLPEGMSRHDPCLQNAEVVSEKRYTYPAGVIPDVSSKPAHYFEVNVENQSMAPELAQQVIAQHFQVYNPNVQNK